MFFVYRIAAPLTAASGRMAGLVVSETIYSSL